MASTGVKMAVDIECPACQTVVTVPFTISGRHWDNGRQYLDFEPDMTDLWAHAWTHETPVGNSEETG